MPPTLVYWNIRGVVVPIQMLLTHADVSFEFKEYNDENEGEKWFKVDKPQLAKVLDFPNLPYYIDDDVKLTHVQTIMSYLGRKHNLDGKTEEELLRISLIMEQIADLKETTGAFIYLPASIHNVSEVQETLLQKFLETLPSQIERISKFLGSNDWVAGSRLTYADFCLYDILDAMRSYFDDGNLNGFPNLGKFMANVEELPRVGKFLATQVDKIPNDLPQYQRYAFMWKKKKSNN